MNGFISAAKKESSKVLANIRLLSDTQKGEAFSTAASIDLAKGSSKAALPKLEQATEYFIQSGEPSRAADTLNWSADVSLRENKADDAIGSVNKAIELYTKDQNKAGAAESVYKLAQIKSSEGNTDEAHDLLKKYLDLDPTGDRAAEIKTILSLKQKAF